jgi:REP element-mobilizing transposase RayT
MWNDTDTPLAYLFSFHSYGTWLHGDKRGSVDRFHNRYGAPRLPENPRWLSHNRRSLRAEPFRLGAHERRVIKDAIQETCQIRKWVLLAVNGRTNHVHVVVSAHTDADRMLNAFKANATRKLREEGLWQHPFSPWVRKGSKRRLWNEKSVSRAIDYVLFGQGDDLPDFDD